MGMGTIGIQILMFPPFRTGLAWRLVSSSCFDSYILGFLFLFYRLSWAFGASGIVVTSIASGRTSGCISNSRFRTYPILKRLSIDQRKGTYIFFSCRFSGFIGGCLRRMSNLLFLQFGGFLSFGRPLRFGLRGSLNAFIPIRSFIP